MNMTDTIKHHLTPEISDGVFRWNACQRRSALLWRPTCPCAMRVARSWIAMTRLAALSWRMPRTADVSSDALAATMKLISEGNR